MKEFLIDFIGISLAMSVVTAIALLLRRLMKNKFTAISRYVIWTLILVRLCIPMSIIDLPSLITIPTSNVETPVYEIREQELSVQTPVINNTEIPKADEVIDNSYVPEHTSPVTEKAVKKESIDPYKVIFIIWITVAAAFFITSVTDYLIGTYKLKRSLSAVDDEIREIYYSVCRDMGIKSIPPIYMSRGASSPMVYGFLRPRVILPDISYDGTDLEGILRHELVHYKRGDLYFKLVSLLANSLNWFNPLVYIACDMHSRDMELACDEAALSKREISRRLDYGESLLHIITRCKPARRLTTGFNPKKSAVKERFENIANTDKRKKGFVIVGVVLILTLLCSCIIGCVNTDRYNSVPTLDELGKTEDENRQQIFDAKVFPVLVKDSEEEWKLFYEDEKLLLAASDGRCFEYGKDELEIPYRHENIYYSADITIVDDLGILNYSVPPTEDRYGTNCFVMINTKHGEVLNTLTVDAQDIVELHGGNYHDLSPFTAERKGEYYFESGASWDDEGNYNVSVILNTPLGVLVSSSSYDTKANSFAELYKDSGNSYTMGRYTDDPSYITELEGVSVMAYNNFTHFIAGDLVPSHAEKIFHSIHYNGYSTITFGNTDLIYATSKGGFSVNIEVTKSDYAEIPVGIHEFSFSDVSISHTCSDCNGESPYSDEAEARRQEQGIFHVYTDTWRTESIVWRLVHEDGALVLSHGDGRRFEYAKGIYDHEKYSGARGYVYGNYGGIMYWTASDEIHFLGLDLNDGKILFSYEPTVEEILELHGKSIYLTEANKCQFGGYIYASDTTIIVNVNLTAGEDIDFTVQKDYDPDTDTLSKTRPMTWAIID